MAENLFAGFLDDPQQYRASVHHWRDAFKRARTLHRDSDWTSRARRSFADGTSWPQDGNPIFEAYSRKQGRSLHIIQQVPDSNDLQIASWLKPAVGDEAARLAIAHELCINVCLSREASVVAERLITVWIDPETTLEGMLALMEGLLS